MAELKYEQYRLDEHAEEADKNQRAKENLYETVANCVQVLSHLDYQQVKTYLDDNLPEQKQELIDEFHNYFDDVPKDNPLRIKILEVMCLLGITIYSVPEPALEETVPELELEAED
jgi:hypothetical protein